MSSSKRVMILAGLIALSGALDLAGETPVKETPQSRVARGKYLVEGFGCSDCHTPKKMGPQGPEWDTARLLCGHPEGSALPAPPKPAGAWIVSTNDQLTAWAGPWGISYAINLTPDENTGIGIWTEEMFVKALKTGRHMGASRPILPPMPWPAYRNLTEEDLKAIHAYLRTIRPIHNRIPEPVLVEDAGH